MVTRKEDRKNDLSVLEVLSYIKNSQNTFYDTIISQNMSKVN